MILKSLFVLSCFFLCCSAADSRDSDIFRIHSERFGDATVRYDRYLGFSLYAPAYFRFTDKNVLQHVETDNCVTYSSSVNRQLMLSDDCNHAETWSYDPDKKLLIDTSYDDQKYCFAPWRDPLGDEKYLAGLSPCSTIWEQLDLVYDYGSRQAK